MSRYYLNNPDEPIRHDWITATDLQWDNPDTRYEEMIEARNDAEEDQEGGAE